MKSLSIIFTTAVVAISAISSLESNLDLETEWQGWKEKNDKHYTTMLENSGRFGIWKSNYEQILKHNNEVSSYKLAMNKFGDLTQKEFVLRIHGHNESCLQEFDNFAKQENIPIVNPGLHLNYEDLPESIDWTELGVVTPVKDQGSCGSCWAFSAVGSTESRYAIATGELNSLSEQELVDCSSVNAGCSGGNMDTALLYVKMNSGLALESEYVYTAEDGTCEADDYTHYDAITGINLVEHENATALMAALLDGPVSIGIQADQLTFQFYSEGVFDGRCGTSIDHGVVVVGYGVDEDTNDKYWKVRNSWGDTWGEEGYIRMCRECDKNDDEGECCILCQPSFPTV